MLLSGIKPNILTSPISFLGLTGLGLIAIMIIIVSLKPGTPVLDHSSRSKFIQDSQPSEIPEHQWIVSGEQAKILLKQGATLLDARSLKILHWERLKDASFISWQDFSPPNPPDRGKLLSDDQVLTQKLQAIGIFSHKPVIVYIDPKTGWGEEGRIVWMLRSLGHSQAVWVDGGYAALVKAGLTLENSLKPTQPPKGDFQVKRRPDWEINRSEIKNHLNHQNLVIIDSREPREYAGETPYGEQRGGHLPGAIHLYYKDWLDENGMLLPRQVILDQLAEKGITPEKEIVSYCTGGVRSAWLTSVLVDLGFSAKNYPGSMWEWSASPPEEYPLLKLD